MSVEEQISELIGKYEGLDAHRLKQFNEVIVTQAVALAFTDTPRNCVC